MNDLKTITYEKVCEKQDLKFVTRTSEPVTLKKNQYYALMVTDIQDSPHVQGVEPYTHQLLVGIERPSQYHKAYISKEFRKRRNSLRGTTVVVEVKDVKDFYIL